jgi:hypothetical protein
MCHDAAMWHWLERRITANPADPVPRALTIAGLAMSAAAWAYGWFAGFDSFLLNTAAALGIVGPALLLSNVVVKALQDARGRTRVRPLLLTVNELLWEAFGTAAPVLNALGYEGPRQLHQALLDRPDFAKLATELSRTQRRLEAAFVELNVDRNDIIRNIHPLIVPRFSLIARLLQEADRQVQMPSAPVRAVVAKDWGEICGFDFIIQFPPEGGSRYLPMRDRKIGLVQIRQDSEAADPAITGAQTIGYVRYVCECLFYAANIATMLANEAPAGLFQ